MKSISSSMSGNKLTIIVLDEDFRRIATFKFSNNNKKAKEAALRTLKEKYGVIFPQVLDRDLDWATGNYF